MKTKLLTVTAFSLMMAAGIATAQSTSDSQPQDSTGNGTTGAASSPTTDSDGNPIRNNTIDPNVTNSTLGDDSDKTCKLPDGTTSTTLERGADGNCVQ